MNNQTSNVDFVFELDPEDYAQLKPLLPASRLAWAAAREWTRAGSLAAQRVRRILVECDVHENGRLGGAFPFLYLTPGNAIRSNGTQAPGNGYLLDLLETLLPASSPTSFVTKNSWYALSRASNYLMRLGALRHVGLLEHRGPLQVRLQCSVNSSSIRQLLEEVGWPGPKAQVHEAVQLCQAAGIEHVALQFAVHEQAVDSRLGLEFTAGEPASRGQWELITRDFVRAAWMDPNRADVLCRWPGRDVIYDRALALPMSVRRKAHVKLSFDSNATPSSKAYLWWVGAYTL